MIWQSTAQLMASFVIAALTVWYSPVLLALLGLDEFVFVGQLCITILALSVLDTVFRRLP